MNRTTLIAALLLSAASFPVAANDDQPADTTWQLGVPARDVKGARTGYQIPGCAHFVIDGTRVKQVCAVRSPANPLFWKYQEMIGGGESPPK